MEHRPALQRIPLSVSLCAIALALLIGLSGFTPSASTPKITWTPGTVDQMVSPGSTYETIVSFTSSQAITDADVSFTPSLQRILTLSPTQFATISPGVAYRIRLAVMVPADSNQQEYNGELMLRMGNAALADSLKLRFRTGLASPTPTATPPQSPNSFQLIDAALARHEITLDQAALYKIYALFGAKKGIPQQYISTVPVPGDGTMLFLEALKDWDSLTPQTQAKINAFITPKQLAGTAPFSQQVVRTPTPTSTPGTPVNPMRPTTPTGNSKLEPKPAATRAAGTGITPLVVTYTLMSWERSSESDTINGGSVGAGVSAGLQLPTSPQNVWDNGTYTPAYNKSLVPPGTQWASWPQKYSVDIRHFKATFTLPAGLDPATAQGILYDPYYATDLVPINDNLYVFVNGVQRFRGGTNYAGVARGSSPYETDGWYIPNGITLSGFQAGTNVIDIVTEERYAWGGLGFLDLRFGPRGGATPTPTATATATPTPAPKVILLIGGCALTEYYDTPAGNFRIYYTRTYPNLAPEYEEDCTVQNPNQLIGGHPVYVIALGEGLETSYARFQGMGYPAAQVPRETASGRYPVYISSNPIWTDIPGIGGDARGITLPDHMFINHTVPYIATLQIPTDTAPVDSLRGEVANHEFYHALQWLYVPNVIESWLTNDDFRWWMEATARWAEPKVYAQNGTYPGDADALLSEPFRSMVSSDRRAYGSALFARYLEDKVAAPRYPQDSAAIIRKTWEEYKAHSNQGMVTAIDRVLRRPEYKTTLVDEFPKFTWNNYFMVAGTFDTNLGTVYKNLADPLGPDSQHVGWQEWQLFRSWLAYPRKDWSGNDPLSHSNGIPNAAALVDRPAQYPWLGPSFNYSPWVETWGAAYFEFLGGARVAPGSTLRVTLETNSPPSQARRFSRISALPILDFLNGTKPQNQFLTPAMGPQGPSSSRYTLSVANFDRCSRVTVIVNNVGGAGLFLDQVAAEVVPPAPGTVVPPCSLQ